ncbi:MAG: hypothetical protein ACREAC_17290, partial [Blastocatellia bacterium]
MLLLTTLPLLGLTVFSVQPPGLEHRLAGPGNGHGHNSSPTLQMSMTGREVPGMSAFDRMIPALMEHYEIPGGAIGVVN